MIYKPHYEAIIQSRGYRILRNVVTAVLDKETELTLPEWSFLGLIADSPNIRPIEVASILAVDPPFVTVMIARLVELKLITTEPNKKDRRSKLLVLSRKGKNLIENIEHKVHSGVNGLLTGVNPADLKIYFKVLETVIKNDQIKQGFSAE